MLHGLSVTCADDWGVRARGQQPQRVEVAVVQHVVLKLLQRQRGLKELPVTVIWEVIVNEQGRVSQKVKLIVPGRREKLGKMSNYKQGILPPCSSGGFSRRMLEWFELLIN